MPQMAPISWLILFILFSITFMMFNILNYYCFNKMNKSIMTESNTNQTNNSLNWKW